MPRPAIVTEDVTREPGEQVVLFLDLGKLWPVVTLSASVTDGTPLAGDGGADEVRAMLVMLVANTLAAVALRAGSAADADLVDLGALGAARNEPATGTLVAGEDLVAHELE
jgi:hypothetical protein